MKTLHQEVYDAVAGVLVDLRRPLSDAQEGVVIEAVAEAIDHSRLARKILPFKTREAAEALEECGRLVQAFECIASPNRYGYLRQVQETVKRKGKRAIKISYVDSRGTVIPKRLAEDIIF